jgi:hypothetical protein
MIDLRIAGVSLVLQPGTTVPMELLNGALSDGLEDSFSLPFEVPEQGNEVVLQHVGQLGRNPRTTTYPNASLYYEGELKHVGIIYVENVENGVVQLSFSVDGFVSNLKDKTLPEVDYGGVISITGEATKLVDWAALRNAEAYPTASHCFPMHFNPELQSANNPSYFPDHPTWLAGSSYSVNDLVSYETGTIVRRTFRYQCIISTTPGQNPRSHPSHWRRTAYGIVNHWDHASTAFYENNLTDGNAFAMVPFFYWKWVLLKVYAELGYELQGDFMDDTRTHQLALFSNTAVDDGTRAGYFCVAQTGGQVMGSTPGVFQANTETGGTLSDLGGLWNQATGRFTCDSAGRRYFQMAIEASFSGSAIMVLRLVDDATNTVLVSQQVPGQQTSYNGTYTLTYDFIGGQVGLDFRLELVAYLTLITLTPTGATISAFTLTSWLADVTSLLNAHALSINPQQHVPEQSLAEFILDTCELFALERRYDHSRRVAYLNYKKHVLTDEPADITAQLRAEPVLRLQELPKGYRFTHNVQDEDAAELANRTHEPDVDIEADLATPPSTRSYVVVRNSRRLYVSRHAADGNLYWWPAGWYVPSELVGEDTDPTEVQPGWVPMVMDLVTSNGEEFLVPVISEAGNSAMFATEGNASSKRFVLYHGLVRNANGVDYPYAASWNMEHAGTPVADLSLAWEGTDGLLAVLAGTYYERMAKAEVLEVPVEANATVLAAMNNRPVMVHYQRCLIERLPITYGDGTLPLIAEGARLYRLPPA